MDKTPEELAEEYLKNNHEYFSAKEAFLAAYKAGYQAASAEYEARIKEVSANWTFCCEDKARLLQELAAKEQL